jgi:hypothetical protein
MFPGGFGRQDGHFDVVACSQTPCLGALMEIYMVTNSKRAIRGTLLASAFQRRSAAAADCRLGIAPALRLPFEARLPIESAMETLFGFDF